MNVENPQWLNDGKATEAYTKDMTVLGDYYTSKGFTQDQVDAVNSNAIFAQAVIDAARYDAMKTKKAIVEKRVRKAPVNTKPRALVLLNGVQLLVSLIHCHLN